MDTRSEERRTVTESSLRVPLTISSLFTNWVPILRTMVVTHTIFVFQISMINMQKILAEISIYRVRNYDNPQHEPNKKSKLNINKARRVWLFLSQNSYANLLEDLIEDIVVSKIILLLYVLPLGVPYNKQQRS